MYLSRYVRLRLCLLMSVCLLNMFLWFGVCVSVCAFVVSLFIVVSFCVQNIH